MTERANDEAPGRRVTGQLRQAKVVQVTNAAHGPTPCMYWSGVSGIIGGGVQNPARIFGFLLGPGTFLATAHQQSPRCLHDQERRRVSLYLRARRGRRHMRLKRSTSITTLAPNILQGSASVSKHELNMHKGLQQRRQGRRRSSCANR